MPLQLHAGLIDRMTKCGRGDATEAVDVGPTRTKLWSTQMQLHASLIFRLGLSSELLVYDGLDIASVHVSTAQ